MSTHYFRGLSLAAIIAASFSITSIADTHYVSTNGLHVSPFTNWVDAATNIQDAVDAAEDGDTVLISNGVYFLSTYISIQKGVSVIGAGADQTVIDGNGVTQCAYLYHTSAVLKHVTLRNGYAVDSPSVQRAGGVNFRSGTIEDCRIVDNYGDFTGGLFMWGGGARLLSSKVESNTSRGCGGIWTKGIVEDTVVKGNFSSGLWSYSAGGIVAPEGTVEDCLIIENHCDVHNEQEDNVSGGVSGGFGGNATLIGCTIVSNTVEGPWMAVGGVWKCDMKNCIVRENRFTSGELVNWDDASGDYCCTTPLPFTGTGNITNDPQFIATDDLHLSASSPCIDAGTNGAVITSTDLDGLPRIVNGTVDMGAYEYQYPDTDEDGMSDRHEYFSGTSDTNPASCLMFEDIGSGSSNGVVVTWQGVAGKLYGLYRSTNLLVEPLPLQTNIPGVEPMNVVTDTTAIGYGPWYYRVILE
jgi:hypothetical protein